MDVKTTFLSGEFGEFGETITWIKGSCNVL
jgi:hypothetical protein